MYKNASEVIREALRLLHENDERKEIQKQLLLRELAPSINALERGKHSIHSLQDIRQKVLDSQKEG